MCYNLFHRDNNTNHKNSKEGIIISNRISKPKKTSADLVRMLKDEKGITFNYISEKEAAEYLSDRNNYLRTASYRKNYSKHISGENEGKYINLDFSYLTDLSTIDMHLRYLLLKMCIDLEHSLKVSLISEIEQNSNEDGYTVVDGFLAQNPNIKFNIEKKSDSIFTGELIAKYFDLCTVFDNNNQQSEVSTKILNADCPAWVLVEIISFGDLIKFYNYYHSLYPQSYTIDNNILNPIRSLRNACAHNNCLLNCLSPQGTTPPHKISNYVKGIPDIGNEERKKKLSCRPLFEIVCLLYVYNQIVSVQVKRHRLEEFKKLIDERLFRNISYYSSNQTVLTSLNFLRKVVDKSVSMCL